MPDIADLKVHIGADVSDAEKAFASVGSKIGGLGSSLANVASTAGGFVLGGAITALPGLLMDAAKGAAADEQATARLEKSVRNLGDGYDMIMGQVNGAIAAGQKLAFTDDQVRDSFQFLLAATDDHEEALRRQTAAMDLSRGANIPLSQATKMLGKMTEDNVNTFKKLGIELPKTATEAEALAAIQERFSGQAEAYANSTAGQFEQAQIAIDETKEALGAALLPVLARVGSALVTVLPQIQEVAGWIGEGISDAVTTTLRVLDPLTDSFGSLIDIFQGGDAFDVAAEALDRMFPIPVVDGILNVVANIGDLVHTVFEGDIPGVLEAAQGVFSGFGEIIVGLVDDWALALVDWIGPMETDMLAGLADTAQSVGTWLITSAATLVEKLATWAAAFIDWIAPMTPDLLRALGGYIADMVGWIAGTALPMIVTKLLEWGAAFVEWVQPRIPPLLLELGKLLLELGGWLLTTALPAIVSKLAEWAGAFIAWVGPMIPGLIADLMLLQGRITTWMILTALPAIVAKLVEWGDAFTAWVAKDVIPTLPEKLGAILTSISGWVGDKVGAVAESVKGIGSGILTGIRDGISGALGGFWSWLQESFVDKIPSFVRTLLDIKSPSGVFAGIGRNIVDGLRVGMESRLPSIDQIISRLVGSMSAVSGDATAWLGAAMAMTGAGPDWLSGLQRLTHLESTGNPHAVNPVSVGGEHATGLLQTLPSTFRSFALPGLGDILNPIHNAASAIRYIKSTYGHVNNIPGLYGDFKGYAAGGWAGMNGPELAVLGERGPEYVVSNHQLGRGGGGNTYITLDARGAQVYDGSKFEDILVRALGKAQRGGKIVQVTR